MLVFKKEALAEVFSCEFWETFKNTLFYRTPLVAAYVSFESILYLQWYCAQGLSSITIGWLQEGLNCVNSYMQCRYLMPKITQFHLNLCCGNFMERHSFRTVSGDPPKTLRKYAFPQNLHTRKLHEITVFFAVQVG